MSDNHSKGTDTGAAYLGLIGGAIFIGAILYTIVLLTNSKYAGEKKEGGAKASIAAVVTNVG